MVGSCYAINGEPESFIGKRASVPSVTSMVSEYETACHAVVTSAYPGRNHHAFQLKDGRNTP